MFSSKERKIQLKSLNMPLETGREVVLDAQDRIFQMAAGWSENVKCESEWGVSSFTPSTLCEMLKERHMVAQT